MALEFDPTSAKPAGPAKFEFDPTSAKPDGGAKRSISDYARDVAGTAINSAIGVPEAIVGLADIPTGGAVGKFLENEGGSVGFRPKQAKEFVNETIKSDASREARRKFAEADGIVDKTVAAVQNPSLIVEGVGESLGAMGAGGVAARGLMAATKLSQMGARGAALAGAAGEGATMAGSAAEQIRQETPDGLLTPTQAGLAAATGVVGGALGAVGGRVAQKLGIGDVDTMLAQGTKGMAADAGTPAARAATNPLVQQQAAKSIPRRVIEGAIAEGFLEELPQSVAEQVFQNVALGKDWLTDVDAAVVMGLLTGSAMGGAAAGFHGMTQTKAGADVAPQADPAAVPADGGAQPGAVPPNSGTARIQQAFADQLAALQQQEQGEPSVPQTAPPDGAAALAQQQAQAAAQRQAAMEASRAEQSPDDEIFQTTGAAVPPSVAMGLDPAAGPLSAGAALAVDSGASDQMQQAAALAQAAEVARTPGKKPAQGNQKQEQQALAQQGVDPETGEISQGSAMQEWIDAELSSTFRGAQSREVRMQLAQELGRRRALREQQELQAELDAEQRASVPGAERADAAFASVIEDAGQVPADLTNPTITQGVTDGPQAAQAQQGSAQPPQGAAAPAVARRATAAQGSAIPADPGPDAPGAGAASGALNDGAPAQILGAQAAPAAGAQAAAQGEDRAQRVARTGEAWTRMPAAERQALAQRTDLKHIVRKNVHRAAWADLNGDVQRKLADAMGTAQQAQAAAQENYQEKQTGNSANQAPATINPEAGKGGDTTQLPVAESPKNSAPALAQKAPAATESVAPQPGPEDSLASGGMVAERLATPRKKPAARGVLAKRAEAEEKARADYFTPGNVIKSYGGHDRVVSYLPPDADGRWSVTVRAVRPEDGKWVDAPGVRERTHATPPDARELKTGPVARAAQEEAPAPEPAATEPSAAPVPVTATPAQAAADAPAPADRITDFGEKIGGARKDQATNKGAKAARPRSADERPAWARRFEVSQIAKSSRVGEEGRWVVRDTRRLDAFNQPRQMGRETYATREEAEQAVPLLAVSQKHRLVPARGDGAGYEIWRDVSDRKRVKVVDQVFPTREAALEYMAGNAQAIIETNTTFGEADLPRPPSDQRLGAERRTSDARDSDFMEVFGFRGVEFGNWNNQQERQELLNDAYDGLLDLAEVMDIPPRAISLNGELALAFGARGHGLSGARAHYELDKVVINLTKMNGAGSLAHEWFHALDHYFGRQDGKAPADWVVAKDGTRSLRVHDAPEDDMASGGTRGERSGMRPELREAFADVMRTIARKAEAYVEDAARADKFVATARQEVKQRLDGIRAELARDLDARYYKRYNKAATADQLAEFDSVAEKIVAGELLELRVESKGSGRSITSGIRWTNDALNRLSVVMKAVRGRQGFSADQDGPLDRLRGLMQNYSARLKMLADAQASTEKSRAVPTEFVMNAKELDQGRGQDYWTRPHELAARAFQGYVEDKIAERGGRSPFLNYGPENAVIPTPWGFKRPFPAGAERAAINQSLDKLVEVIQTREGDDGGVVLFSRSPDTQAAYEARIDALFSGEPAARVGARVLDRSDVLGLLEIAEKPLVLQESKVVAGQDNHPHMTAAVWKKVPAWLDNPAAVFNSDTESGRLVFVAPEMANGGPVVMIVEPNPVAGGKAMSVSLLANAYDKSGGSPFGRWIADGLLKYADTKTFPAVFAQSVGRQLPDTALKNKPGTGRILTEKHLSGYRRANSPTYRAGSANSDADADFVAALLRILGRSAAITDTAKAQAVATVQSTVDSLRAGWASGPEVVVAFDMQDPRVPEVVRKADLRQRSGGAQGAPEGFYYRGKAYLMASRLSTPADVARVLYHEVMGHHGLRGKFGPELDKVLNQVATMRKAEVAAKMQEYGLRGVNSLSVREAAEEVLAEMAEKNPRLHFVQRAISAIRNFLRANVPGFRSMRLTDNDIIQAYILPARGWVERAQSVDAGAGPELRYAMPTSAGAAGQTSTPAFAEWFGDSQVVNPDGTPKVVYHGTADDFSVFSKAELGKNVRTPASETGFFFTDRSDIAQRYAEMRQGTQQTMPVFLSLKNPTRASFSNMMEADRFLEKGYEGDGAIIEVATPQGRRSTVYAVKRASQIKSAIGNNGNFDPSNDDILFSRSKLQDIKESALGQLQQTMSHAGKVSLWDKTVGTMRHLGERAPAFKPVYEAAQRFIDDVSMLGNDAADRAPRLLPRVETLADLKKKPITAADNQAVAKPLFEGTLLWARDVDGTPVTTEALNDKYRNATPDEKAQILLRTGKIQEQMLKVWRGLPVDQYNTIINNKFDSTILKPGVLWSEKELKDLFGLNAQQVSLYQEARSAIDRSIDMTARADMLRALGAGYADLREAVLAQATVEDAMVLITDTLQAEAREFPEQADRILNLNNAVVKSYERAKALMDAGYAPLSRLGRYTVDVVGKDGTREYFGMFESMYDSNKMEAAMEKEFPGATVTQGTMSDEAFKLFQGITPESLEHFGEMLGLSGEGTNPKDKAFQAYLQLAKNNHSALKRLIHRKGISGYSEDVGRVLASFVYSNARLAAGGLNAGTLETAIEGIPKEQGELRDVAMGLRSYIQDPQEEGQAVRGMLFAQYLGGSVASAVVNMTQPFQITMPWLSQYGGMAKASKQMAMALNDMRRSWMEKGFEYEDDLAKALHAAEVDGVVSPQEIHQLMAQARGTGSLRSGDGTKLGDARAAASNNWERVKVAWGQPFALAEQFNRRSTFIAAYRMAKEQGMASPAEFARRAVVETQFVYSKANKMRWGRGAIGGTLMTFKTYSVSYLELMQRMWTQGGPEGKRAVGWAVAMLLLMGGAGGLPFMEDAEDLIDGAGQLMGYNVSTKQWRKQMLRETIGKELADFVEQGVSGLPGAPIDVSGRLGMGNLLPGTGLLLSKQNRERDLLEVAGPAGDLIARGFTGARKALTGDLAGAALEVSPVAVRNVAKGADMAASGIYKDTKGYKVIDTTLDEAIAKAIGFQPKSVAQVQEAAGFMQRSRSFYVKTSSEIKAQWAQALFNKDEAALEDVRERLAAWNRNNPEQPIVVKMPDVWKRVREMGKDRNQRIAETAPKALREQMRNMARENG